MDTLLELAAREREVAREWEWLQAALQEVADAHAEGQPADAFRLLYAQSMSVGRRRLELWSRIAHLERARVDVD